MRKEDLRLLTGKACFSDDINLPGQAYAVMLRSPHAHARIERIHAARAMSSPGVLAVLTGADFLADGLNSIPHRPVLAPSPPDIRLANRDGSEIYIAPHYPLPADKARFVGEAVAMVVAESLQVATDGAELVEIDYEPLPFVTGSTAAARSDAPLVWEERRSNVCVDAEIGDAMATRAAFARAAHVVRLETWIQRVTAVPMEPRAAIGAYDAVTKRYTLYAGSGSVQRQKRELAWILGVEDEAVRVISRDVGGNFGTRNAFPPEFALVAWAARRLGRPVKWTGERHEAFLGDYQGRDLLVHAELALNEQGDLLALRSSNLSNLGAHSVSHVPLTKGVELMSSVYRLPVAQVCARAVLSNTPPTNSYRSSGRPEAMFVIERLIDLAALQHGFDRIELRRRNLIPEASPYANPLGLTYDGGAYGKVMSAVLALADWEGFPARREAARQLGRLRGIGLANYIEATLGYPTERAEITVRPEGQVDVVIGTLSSGQGHETSFAQLLVEWLGVPFESVRLITGDTDVASVGGGSHAGRSMRLGSIVISRASDAIVAKGIRIAAHALEAAEMDIEFERGRFSIKGTDRSIGIFQLAEIALKGQDLPDELCGPLAAACSETVLTADFPFGSQVCEVEVDPDTGVVEIQRVSAVDDVGRAINPLILQGQTHGGFVQGAGQALLEQCYYEPESGQMLSASFMDYAMPRADHFPNFATELSEVPSPTHPLGVRAGGEGGTTPALASVVNAIVDALSEIGVTHIEMPATPERVWRAIRTAREAGGKSKP